MSSRKISYLTPPLRMMNQVVLRASSKLLKLKRRTADVGQDPEIDETVHDLVIIVVGIDLDLGRKDEQFPPCVINELKKSDGLYHVPGTHLDLKNTGLPLDRGIIGLHLIQNVGNLRVGHLVLDITSHVQGLIAGAGAPRKTPSEIGQSPPHVILVAQNPRPQSRNPTIVDQNPSLWSARKCPSVTASLAAPRRVILV